MGKSENEFEHRVCTAFAHAQTAQIAPFVVNLDVPCI